MDSILEKNLYLFKEHLGLIKAHNNYDIYDPESKEMILHCREKIEARLEAVKAKDSIEKN